MGIPCAGHLANILMDGLDRQLSWLPLWCRYIDDAIVILRQVDVAQFENILLNFHNRIKFKIKYDHAKGNFIDLTESVKNLNASIF